MIKIVNFLLFGILFFAFSGANAQTIAAASCKESDVSTALNSIKADGTTVTIPSGDCIWTTKLSYAQTNSFTLQGAGAVYASTSTATGQGVDSTIIEDNTGASNGTLAITTIAGKSLRVTGIAFKLNSAQTQVPYNGEVVITGVSTSVRLDHNHIVNIPGHGLFFACVNGVVDHNQFDLGSSLGTTDGFLVQQNGCVSSSDVWGNASWNSPTSFGSSGFMFFELNSFNATSGETGYAEDCSAGGRFVLRFNIMWYHVMSVIHGTDSSGRGCRAVEEYDNMLTWSATPITDSANTWVQFESGTGLFWGNTFTGYMTVIQADVVRANTVTYTEAIQPNGFGYCGTTYGPSAWDGNTNPTGYPCLDSVGRGQSDLLSGAFPNVCDMTTGCTTYSGSWPNQALDPVYMWNTTYNAPPDEGNDAFWTTSPAPIAITENQDYYLQLPNYGESATFSGAAGVGQGMLASMPSTCAIGVAYWATNQGTWNTSGTGGQGLLYKCTSTNTWTLFYTPYTYPHPLDVPASGPAPPVKVQASPLILN